MIYTSNYAKHGNHPDAVSISRYVPHFFSGRCAYSALAPSESILAQWRDAIASNNAARIKNGKDIFRKRYREEILDKLDPQKVWKDIGIKAILVCYESGNDFCHRHIAADWLMEKLEITITELPARGRVR